ncbi:polysaccharide deacetylase family protein [Nocardioides aurantiacus]|uniref:polysaccharide deacetylase family protein n=1 Tax=Nocardioides aurantiacus TaxID=86796 RepID=UPI00403F8BA7
MAAWSVLLASPASAADRADRTTVVSFTFTGGYAGQEAAARILGEAGVGGTFYVNSGYVGFPAYLGIDQLREIARHRSEIGGAALDGQDLTGLDGRQAHERVCDDRATLTALGFAPTSFAYPRGSWSYTAQTAARSCGYNSARGLSGLRHPGHSCESCPTSETIPARNAYALRTSGSGADLAQLRRLVGEAEREGGGWVPLALTRVCDCPEQDGAVTPRAFAAFVRWVLARPGVEVRTVDDVVEGPLREAEGTPLARLVPTPEPPPAPDPPALPTWRVLGLPLGQAQIIFTGLAVAATCVVTYRRATRAVRHAQ